MKKDDEKVVVNELAKRMRGELRKRMDKLVKEFKEEEKHAQSGLAHGKKTLNLHLQESAIAELKTWKYAREKLEAALREVDAL